MTCRLSIQRRKDRETFPSPFRYDACFFCGKHFYRFGAFSFRYRRPSARSAFLMLVLIFMSAFINQKHAMIYGFIFGFLYDMNYTSLLGVYMFGFAGLCYLASKAFKVLHTNAFVVILIAVLAVCLLEFYVFGIQSLIHKDIMTFNGFVLDRFIPTILLNIVAALILVLPFRLFFMSLKKELRDE